MHKSKYIILKCHTSSFFLVQNNKTIKEPRGKIHTETIESIKSIIFKPNKDKSLKTEKPSIVGKHKISMKIQLIKQAFFLDQVNKSHKQDIIASKTAKTVDKAAKVIKIKNKLPHN